MIRPGQPARHEDGAITPIEKARNLGPKSAEWLREVGIDSLEALRVAGAPIVYRMLRDRHQGINALMLWALNGAIDDRHWQSYSDEEKEQLRREAELVEVLRDQSDTSQR